MADAQAGAMVKFFGGEQAKVTVLAFNTAHNTEHYGNIVTDLRMQGGVLSACTQAARLDGFEWWAA